MVPPILVLDVCQTPRHYSTQRGANIKTFDPDKPLWTCPKCGRRFISRNLWHACGDYSVEGFLQGKGPRPRELFQRFEELIAECGPYEVAPAKTRVAFMGRVRFAGVQTVSERGMTVAFALPKPMPHPRIRKVEEIAPGWYGHTMRVTSPEELDDELLGWLRESYRQMGMQERLKDRKQDQAGRPSPPPQRRT
jgi:hypothetical protein